MQRLVHQNLKLQYCLIPKTIHRVIQRFLKPKPSGLPTIGKKENIKYVVHLGDIVNNNNVPQWENANAAMRTLDGVVPYSVVPGNHDIGANGSANTRDTTLFNTYFPVSDFVWNRDFWRSISGRTGQV